MEIVIKTWADMEKDFALSKTGNLMCEYPFTKAMENAIPKNRKINVTFECGRYVWVIGNMTCFISDDMLLNK